MCYKNEGSLDFPSSSGNLNLGNDKYIAVSKICTHQQCTVDYSQSNDQFVCPCHGSVFSTSGSVVNSPAEDPLKEYYTELSNQSLRIYG